MQALDHTYIKHSFTTRTIPIETMAGYVPLTQPPRVGDLILAEVLTIGKHSSLEGRTSAMMYLFPGDQVVCVFGNRYATDQFEGYVPAQPVAECDLLSIGGVCGEVISAHSSMSPPTRLCVLGTICDDRGQILNQRAFGLPLCSSPPHGEIILVVGASMNAGKTTTVGTITRALSQTGFRVAAAKVTGTAAGKDDRYFMSCGAHPVLNFTDVGYPSTYMLSLDDLLLTYTTLVNHLRATTPDYIVIEVADGIFQRETRMLLESDTFRATVDHVFFAAGDSLAIECGVRYLQTNQWPLRATTGAITQSPLAIREAEEATGVPCLTIEQMLAGEVVALVQAGTTVRSANTMTIRRAA